MQKTAKALQFENLTGDGVAMALDDLARLRVQVFRDWPYLYDGNPENEAEYLRSYEATPGAILVAARDGDRMVGCGTGMPLTHHADARDLDLASLGLGMDEVFYCAESVLDPEYRGRGAGHEFFERREAHARNLGFRVSLFCAVERPEDHPARPEGARDLAPFWRGRGYAPQNAVVQMEWTDLDLESPSEKTLRVWTKPL